MYNHNNNIGRNQNNRAFAGLFFIILGGIYLLRQLNIFFFPTWLFSWPMILITIGILSGIRHNFTRPFAYIMIFLGGAFLLAHLVSVSIFYFWPFIMIAIGISMIMGRNSNWSHHNWRSHSNYRQQMHNDNRVDL